MVFRSTRWEKEHSNHDHHQEVGPSPPRLEPDVSQALGTHGRAVRARVEPPQLPLSLETQPPMSNSADPWRALAATGWASTKQTLHLNSQLLGKIRLALSPPQPNWMFTALYMSPRGLTTGTIPCSDEHLGCMLDIFDSVIRILR